MALIVGLALMGGGFDLSDRHFAGLAAWLVVVGLLVLGAGSRARLGWPFYSAAGLFGCLALLSAISSLWSGSVELSVIEADRVLVYLAFFLAAFLIAQTAEKRQRFAEGIAIAVAITVLLGLASRLLPHVLEVAEGLGSGPRLRYPLGYWNANGAMCGIAVPMLLWMSRSARWSGAALGLGRRAAGDRGDPLLHLFPGRPARPGGGRRLHPRPLARPALDAGDPGHRRARRPAGAARRPRHHSLADNVASQTSVDQGVTVLLILLAGTAARARPLRPSAAAGGARRRDAARSSCRATRAC